MTLEELRKDQIAQFEADPVGFLVRYPLSLIARDVRSRPEWSNSDLRFTVAGERLARWLWENCAYSKTSGTRDDVYVEERRALNCVPCDLTIDANWLDLALVHPDDALVELLAQCDVEHPYHDWDVEGFAAFVARL